MYNGRMSNAPLPKKSLGQHWLNDDDCLNSMLTAADVGADDTVLEIGPGLGTLTRKLVDTAKNVVAVEFDERLARELAWRVEADNLQITRQDILQFDLTSMPAGYKVVANIPYYLTSNLIRVLSESSNPPHTAVLLIQKEVAERVAAEPGAMSLLSVTAQFYWSVTLDRIVKAELFTPPPKVDSQIVVLSRRKSNLFPDVVPKHMFRLVKAGFGERRKTLRNSLSGGLHLSKDDTEQLLHAASIDPGLRAQNLTLEQWHKLYGCYVNQQVAGQASN
jgi:16S rRNA (adenine1518-N6/adenine1519-N6)-dimethyltransferase